MMLPDSRLPLREEAFCFFVGAGISAAPPSCLPLAPTLGADLISAAMRTPGMPSPSIEDGAVAGGHGLPRFEVLMEHLQLHFDPELAFLDPIRYCLTPNPNHDLLAVALCHGVPVLTTNFDILVELACEALGSVCCQAIDDDQFERCPQRVGLYKLHGSTWRRGPGGWEDGTATISVALHAIGRRAYGFAANSPPKLLLTAMLQQRHMIVAGYSGQDDFDIAPVLFTTKSDRMIVWIDHREGRALSARGRTELQAARREHSDSDVLGHLVGLIDEGRRPDEQVVYVAGDTHRVLRTLSIAAGIRLPDEEPGPGGRHCPMPVCIGRPKGPSFAFATPAEGCLFMSLVHGSLGNSDTRAHYLTHGLRIARSDEAVRRSQLLHESASLAIDCGDFGRGARLAREGEELDERLGRHGWRVLDTVSLAMCAAGERRWNDAETMLTKALTYAMEHDQPYEAAVAANNLGVVHQSQGRFEEALEASRLSLGLLRQLGFLGQVAATQLDLAIQCMERGRAELLKEPPPLAAARAWLAECATHLEDSAELFDRLGDEYGLACTMHERGLLAQFSGDFNAATTWLERSLELNRRLGYVSEAGRDLYHIAVCEFAVGRMHEAKAAEEESSSLLSEIGDEYHLAHNLQLRAGICAAEGDRRTAR